MKCKQWLWILKKDMRIKAALSGNVMTDQEINERLACVLNLDDLAPLDKFYVGVIGDSLNAKNKVTGVFTSHVFFDTSHKPPLVIALTWTKQNAPSKARGI